MIKLSLWTKWVGPLIDLLLSSDILLFQYTTNYKRGNSNLKQKSCYNGNNIKSMHLSIEASLKKLRTSYIDILYVHWWDYETPIEEVMNGLHALVMQGKVLYLVCSDKCHFQLNSHRRKFSRVSDTPAWVVSKANTYARLMGKTPFVIFQGA